MAALNDFALAHFEAERRSAFDEVWGEHLARVSEVADSEVADNWWQTSDALLDAWFWFDRPLADGRLVVDALLASLYAPIGGGRTWLSRMRESCMRLYEIVDVFPGTSVGLLDVLSGAQVTVREKTLSRTARRGNLIAARVIRAGASGQPELELSVVAISPLIRESVVHQLTEWRDEFRREHPTAPESAFWKLTPPFFHAAWMGAILDPVIPRLTNTDGEDLLLTQVHFEVVDRERLEAALDSSEDLDRFDDPDRLDEVSWDWSDNARANPVLLAEIQLRKGKLILETNSAVRGQRARALVEGLAGEAVRFVAAAHQDPTESLREQLRAGGEGSSPGLEEEIPAELAEELVLTQMARHYRTWIDESIPALDGATPRAAANEPGLQAKLVALLRGLEGMYQRALQRNEPLPTIRLGCGRSWACRPSWIAPRRRWHTIGWMPPIPGWVC